MKALYTCGLLALLFFSCRDDNPCQPVDSDSPNHPPVLEAHPDTSVIIGDTLRLKASATDPDGDDIKYYLTVILRDTSDTAAAFIDSLTGDFWFAPTVNDLPNRSMMFTAVDEHGRGMLTLFDVAVSYHLDQHYDSFQPNSSINVFLYTPVGQEFTPQLSVLNFVELWFSCSGYSGELKVNIRSGTIQGDILGSSDTVVITPGFYGFFNDIMIFEFDTVTLTPNELHVIEVVQISGFNIMINRHGGPESLYPGGRMIIGGVPNERCDLWFREGAKAPLPAP